MGLWGASQAMAAGFGGLLGAVMVDIGRLLTDSAAAFGAVFVIEAGLFVLAAGMAAKTIDAIRSAPDAALIPGE
jgi:BCD family chlorophyll transporter-like MFS transporter